MGLAMSEPHAIEHVYAGELHHPQTHTTRWPQSPSNQLRRRVETPNTSLTVAEYEAKLAWELFNAQIAHANWAAYRTAKYIRDNQAECMLLSPEWCKDRLCGQMRVVDILLPYAIRQVGRELRELEKSS
jgi:hypothetical protein